MKNTKKKYRMRGIVVSLDGEYIPRVMLGDLLFLQEFNKKLEEAYKKYKRGYLLKEGLR